MLILLLTAFGLVSSATQCHPVKCAPSDIKFNPNECYIYKNDAYNLKLCPPGDFCTAIDSSQISSTVGTCGNPGPQQGPNETCKSTSDCMVSSLTSATVKCSNGFCTGYLAVGTTCGVNTDCVHNSYCDTNTLKCKAVSNADTCYTFTDNPAGNTCEQNMGCVEGKCIPYFSRKAGESCFIWADCETYSCDQSALKCNHASPVSANKAPHTCTSSADCKTKEYMNYENQPEVMELTCACGISQSGNAYCQQTSGDDDWQMWAKVCKEWILSGNMSKCSPERKWESNCVGSHGGEELMEFYRYYGWRLQVAETTDYDNCAGTMYYGEYESARKYLEDHDDLDDDDGDFGAILPLIGAILLY